LKPAIGASAAQRCIEPECGATFDLNEQIYTCRVCGGLLEIVQQPKSGRDVQHLRAIWRARLTSQNERDMSGVWRFRELLPFSYSIAVVTLGEGNTPLYDAPRSAHYCGLEALKLKHQGLNPTGSFKDTGMTTAITQARILGAKTVVCASTGNTAASLAAYAARADLQCAIVVPHGQVSHAKLAQSLDYGAKVLEVEGNFDDAMRLIRELCEDKSIYMVNSINPFRIEGQKTIAFELLEQCHVPHHIIVPGGNLGNSTALGKGFSDLFNLGLIDRMPRLSIVQAEGAAPFARLFAERRPSLQELPRDGLMPVKNPQTLASAIKIGAPVSWRKSIRAVVDTDGWVLSVSEQEIADAKAIIGREGIGCEPASATTVAGIKKLVSDGRIVADESVVAVLTGHFLKDTDYAINYHKETLCGTDDSMNRTEPERRIKGNYSNQALRIDCTRAAILKHLEGR
jgi:threonine synthase